MRHTIAAYLLMLCCASAAAETYRSQSDKYALEINAVEAGEESEVDVRVTDLKTSEMYVFPAQETGRDLRAEWQVRQSQVDMRLEIRVWPQLVTADLIVTKGEGGSTVHTVWGTTPPIVLLNVQDVWRVGGDVKAPVILTRVEPQYPEAARAERVSGIVIIEAVVDKSGTVKDAVVLKDLPYGLGLNALDTVKQWKFAPATRNGEPVDVVFNLTVNFKLR